MTEIKAAETNKTHGSNKDIKYNLAIFFTDGVFFKLSMTLLSITTIIPFFLEQLGASTFQVAMVVSIAIICNFVSLPLFVSYVSRARMIGKTFSRILFTQRLIFLAYVLSIPFLPNHTLIWMFLFFWGVFNLFVGSYHVFYTPLVIKLLPPEKRGFVRGIGFAAGSILSAVAAMALIPMLLGRFPFPYNFVIIFILGMLFLLGDAALFGIVREKDEGVPHFPLKATQFIKEIPTTLRENTAFRTVITVSIFLVVANSLLTFYTVYAIRVFSATEAHIAILTGIAVIANAVAYISFGAVVDRLGAKVTLRIAAFLLILAGSLALLTHSLNFLFVAWALANLAFSCYMIGVTPVLGEICPSEKLPLCTGVQTIIGLILSTFVLFLLAPALEHFGFKLLFVVVLFCGTISLLLNLLFLRSKRS